MPLNALAASVLFIASTLAAQSSPATAACKPSDSTEKAEASSGIVQALLVHKVQPEYPDSARQKKIEGVVVLRATIDECGHVAKLEIISGPSELAQAAMTAVKQWEYRPYFLSGRPVKVETRILVKFTHSSGDMPLPEWKEYVYPENNFAVTLPSDPHPHKSPQMVNGMAYSVPLSNGARFSLYTEGANDTCVDTVRGQLGNAKNKGESTGYKMISFREVDSGEYKGVEFIQQVPTGKVDYERWICAAHRLYLFVADWNPNEPEPKELRRIVDSWRVITDK